jgi:hypothetical protein
MRIDTDDLSVTNGMLAKAKPIIKSGKPMR